LVVVVVAVVSAWAATRAAAAPAPVAPTGSPAEATAAVGSGEPAGPAGDLEPPDGEDSPPDEPPANHRVDRGDTLWTVSEKYFGEPWRWPQLWALNPEITNPHWIFPGQTIRLRRPPAAEGASHRGPEPAPTPAVPARAPLVRGRRQGGLGDSAEVRQLGFVDDGALRAAGTVLGSVEEKIMLASGDQVYVEFPRAEPPRPGARYSVYQVETEHPIREPGSSLTLGYLVHVYGEVVIEGLSDRNATAIASARLVDLVEPVERGYRVGPLRSLLKTLAPRPNAASMSARIVAAVEPNLLIAHQMFVVLNRGQRHGVAVGNRFLVLRQGDGIKRVMEDWDASDHRFPPHAVGEIIAVDVQSESSIGWISHATRELRVGDLADMQKGY
jgi:hypothetical protein